MLSQIQRFGGAMFTPVLLFPFAGIVVGLAILLQNPMFVGESLTDPNSLFAQIVHIIEEGGWTVFRNMPLIPATLTAMLVGITEPLEFTFLFISPLLFAVHAVLAASMSTVMYLFGVVGNMGGGLIDQVLPQNWIPMFSNHADMMLTQIAIGLCFTLLYFVVFRTLILQFNMCTPGREDAEVKLYSKAEYKASRGQTTAAEPKKELDQAAGILQALGGVGNISSINNCATRLRIALHDMSQTLDDEVFKKLGAHGVFRSGDAIQVIIGLHVSQLREQLDSLINSHQSAENVAITEAV